MGPEACKYCGCEEVATKTDSEIVFRCWSSYLTADDYWTVSNNCGARCAVQVVEMRERIQRAVEVLEGATRFDVIPWDGGVCRDPSDGGGEVDADVVDQAIEILKGDADGQTE